MGDHIPVDQISFWSRSCFNHTHRIQGPQLHVTPTLLVPGLLLSVLPMSGQKYLGFVHAKLASSILYNLRNGLSVEMFGLSRFWCMC